MRLDGDEGRRWIICHNPVEAERDAARRGEQLAAVQDELARITAARAAALRKARAQADKSGKRLVKPNDTAHRKAECALRDHPTLGRWIKQAPSGRLTINAQKVTAEQRLDGKYLIATSDPDLSAAEVAVAYKNLLEAERAFRTMKSTLYLRPVYHRLDERIRAHVLLCWLALLLIRVAERRTGATWNKLRAELQRINQVTLEGPAGSVTHTTRLTETQAKIYKDCAVAPPPKLTALNPAE
ncbi:IS1634 family transposase [Streptomyces sp. NPDC059680]|uniref:IS1634 family transposase n=1 Tax=Streptomyces sp. NPDC059680 TaxID=3346904 RepID=UPI00369A67B8